MVRRAGELPTTVQIECPGCGHFNSVSLQYSEGETADYEGVCEGKLVWGGLCGASLLLTVTIMEEVDQEEQ